MIKHLKNTTLSILALSLLFLFSCSDDDESSSSELDDVEFAFSPENPPIDQNLISTLSSSGDPNAAQIAANLSSANAMTGWSALFQQPAGAIKAESLIGSCSGSSIAYTYTEAVQGDSYTITYEICETSSDYIFQVYLSQNGSTPALFMYSEQSKSGNQGFLEVYLSSLLDLTEEEIDLTIRYTWVVNSDGSFQFTVSDTQIGFNISVNVNADNSGDVEYVIDGDLFYEATWNASGTSGTYTYYNSDGSVLDTGSWPA